MDSNNDKKLLFNNLEEYQAEVERLDEIIKNQSKIINQQEIIINQFGKPKTGFRTGEIIPLIMGARTYPKTFPMYGSPLYNLMRKNTPMIMELGLDDTFERRMAEMTDTYFSKKIPLKSLTGNQKPIEELLLMQSKGKFLTKEEKDRCIKHAETIRKKRKK